MKNAHTQFGYIKPTSFQSSSVNWVPNLGLWRIIKPSNMAHKRPIQEIESSEVENLDAVDKPVSSVNIHGIVISLSPIKKGRMRNYTLMELLVMALRNCAWWCLVQNSENLWMTSWREKKQLNSTIARYNKPEEATIWKCLKNTTEIIGSPKKISVSSLEYEDQLQSLFKS